MLIQIVTYTVISLIAVYFAFLSFDYIQSQFSVKRKKNALDIYTKKYQDIIRDQFTQPSVNCANLQNDNTSEPDEKFIPDDDMYKDLTKYAYELSNAKN